MAERRMRGEAEIPEDRGGPLTAEDMRKTLGILLHQGHTLDAILDMTFPQIAICAQAVLEQRMEMVEPVVAMIYSTATGKPYPAKKDRKEQKKREAQMTPEERDEAFLQALGVYGISEEDERKGTRRKRREG
jgi:hypothetical protein